ncbi:MAG TPA: phosphatase PAP2 family protein [Candidatus Saccharimonadales bacterium]|nr:phosphatase PAP2 family protein [Candidatus Saccharimonadales bacterium]
MTTQTIISLIADGAVVPIVIIAGYALLFLVPKGHRFEAYARVLMAGLTAFLLAKLLAAVYQPTTSRPFEILGVEPGASFLPNAGFPSDHALFTGFLTLAVWFETRRKKITIVLASLTLAVCVGRVLALVHTPLDVIGGLLIAAIGALWYLQVDRTPIATTTRKKHKKLVH